MDRTELDAFTQADGLDTAAEGNMPETEAAIIHEMGGAPLEWIIAESEPVREPVAPAPQPAHEPKAEEPGTAREKRPHDGAEEDAAPGAPEGGAGCGYIVCPELCPPPVNAVICGCRDSMIVEAGDAMPEGLGRMLFVDIRLRKICPNRRVALAVIVTEKDCKGKEHQRGIKYFTVPAHHASGCRDVLVKCVKFVLPEGLDVSGGETNGICNPRHFLIRTVVNYVDSDFVCCHAD